MQRIAIGLTIFAMVAATAPVQAGGSDIVYIRPSDTPGGQTQTNNPGGGSKGNNPGGGGGSQTNPNKINGRYVKLTVRLGTSPEGKAWLGANFDGFEKQFAEAIGLVSSSGAIITETAPSGPAIQGGVRAGDVVISFNNILVADPPELRQRLQQQSPGAQVVLEVWRFASDERDFVNTLRRLGESNGAVMARLGYMYSRGTSVERNEAEGARWYKRGAEAGNHTSMIEYAFMLFEGRGVDKNIPEGERYLRNAANSGSILAMYRYALLLMDGKYVNKDQAQAVQFLKRAAEGMYAPAMNELGLAYANGTGVERNYAEALRWYEKAVNLNNAAAMVNMGILYQRGNGVEKNDTKAVEYYRRAADLNQPAGIHNYAAMLDGGKGTQRDSEKAAELVMRAMRMGHEFSYQQMINNGTGYSREFKQAVQRRLQSEGLYNGPIDGEFGQTTQTAITNFFNKRR